MMTGLSICFAPSSALPGARPVQTGRRGLTLNKGIYQAAKSVVNIACFCSSIIGIMLIPVTKMFVGKSIRLLTVAASSTPLRASSRASWMNPAGVDPGKIEAAQMMGA